MTQDAPFALQIHAGHAALAALHAVAGAGAPFQHAGWIGGWCAAHGRLEALRLVRLEAGAGIWWLPVDITRKAGIALARKIGDRHASFFTPLSEGAPPPLTRAMLRAAAQALGVDALHLTDVPAQWAGHTLLAPGFAEAPDVARAVRFEHHPALYGGESGKKLRAKARKLAGGAALEAGFLEGPAAQTGLAQLLAWKGARLAGQGLGDAFGEAATRAFLAAGLEPGGPLRLFALRREGHSVALLLLAQAGGHASGMANAHDPAPGIARHGPGDVLLMHLTQALAQEGVAGFDLGVGEARYKRLHCPTPLVLHDAGAATSGRGALLLAALGAARMLKGRIKRSPALWDAVQGLRKRLRGR